MPSGGSKCLSCCNSSSGTGVFVSVMLRLLMFFIAALWALVAPQAQDPATQRPPDRPPRRNGPGPWDNDVLVHNVNTTNGSVRRLATFERAGVPTAGRLKDGRLIAAHQYFPENDDANFDKVAVRFSSDEGQTWTAPQVIEMKGLPDDMRFPFDPTVVPLPDGRVRLYFTSVKRRPVERKPPSIYSGISSNGINYTFEPGVRFGIEERIVIDCAVVLHKGLFHLYAPDNGPARSGPRGPGPSPEPGRPGIGYYAVSRDGLSFQRTNDVRIDAPRRWLGNAQSDGNLIKFYGTGERQGGVWIASSEDGANWELDERRARIPGADPGAVTLRDGSLLIVATGAPRPGTPSANRRRPMPNPPD